MSVFVEFEPVGRRGDCPSGKSILECARFLGVDISAVCGGRATCGNCVILVSAGKVSPVTAAEKDHLGDEKLAAGYRLACLAYPTGNVRITVPPESLAAPQRAQVEGDAMPIEPDALVRCMSVQLDQPTLTDLAADADRLSAKLAAQGGPRSPRFDIHALGMLSDTLREDDYHISVTLREDEIIAVSPRALSPLGLAVDLGTTKIAVYLVDLETGNTLQAKGLLNPQITYGEDIIARLAAAMESRDAATHLRQLILDALNNAAESMCAEVERNRRDIVDTVIVGNTAMYHLLLGLSVMQLGRSPFVSSIASAFDVKARDIGLCFASGAYVHFLPSIAGFVGADHVAMLLATSLPEEQGVALALDIGTNTEICLADRGKLTSLSTASGPAFEGANIKFGMRAVAGAIERFTIADGEMNFKTIHDAPAVGLCGSGILDVVAELVTHGIVDRHGRLLSHARVRAEDGAKGFLIAERHDDSGGSDIVLTQRDISQIQLAKGAIRAGIDILMRDHQLTPDDLGRVVFAGAFGTYLNVRNALAIGMLPAVPPERVTQVGNAAGIGAKLALVNRSKRDEAEAIARRVRYIELATDPLFPRTFANAMSFSQ